MTLKEASERFCISMKRLTYYKENKLIMYETNADGVPDYTGEELCKVSSVHDLLEAGMGMDVLQKYLQLLRKNDRQNGADQDSQKAAVCADRRDTP